MTEQEAIAQIIDRFRMPNTAADRIIAEHIEPLRAAWEAGAEAMQKKIAKEFAKNGFQAEASFVLTSSLPRRPA